MERICFSLEQCAGAGLYLQGSDTQQSTQCTYLPQGYKYLSEANSLYLNFYSRTSTVRGGFWITFEGRLSYLLMLNELFCFPMEANHQYAEVHLHCGTRERIGAPISTPLPSVYNDGWSRLVSPEPSDPVTIRHPLFDRDFSK